MSALLAHSKACKAIADGMGMVAETANKAGDQKTRTLFLALQSAYMDAGIALLDLAADEASGEDRRGEKPLGKR